MGDCVLSEDDSCHVQYRINICTRIFLPIFLVVNHLPFLFVWLLKAKSLFSSIPCPLSFGQFLRSFKCFLSRSLGMVTTSENISCNKLLPQHRKQKENCSEGTRELDSGPLTQMSCFYTSSSVNRFGRASSKCPEGSCFL